MKLFPISSSSDSSPTGTGRSGSEKSRALLYLNIYDLTPVNNYLYWFGCGIFHSGVEAHGLEYGFGAHEYPTSGVFEVEPRSCPGFIFRRSIVLGSIDLSHSEFKSFMEHLSNKYHGDTYNLISKNCNHFTEDVCLQLTGKPIPGWVNRLARLGSLCNCLLPESLQATSVSNLPDIEMYSDGSGSGGASSCSESGDEREEVEEEEMGEDVNHHLLIAPNSNVAFLKDKPVRLAKDVL
ncbi:deSI-like protein At4g17486 [Andrographis paniculata]|uniref:deSI-like protein At4g17486 n=1 Tax=Andrographis paniculata TaxID=175694 RepID=UPI0021E92A9F|nr:deSI-like protein At4g17486 [Andrographis paniculata]